MGTRKEIKYRTPLNGNKTKTLDDVEDVDCVGQSDGEHMVIIVNHGDKKKNTVIEPVTDLFGVSEV